MKGEVQIDDALDHELDRAKQTEDIGGIFQLRTRSLI